MKKHLIFACLAAFIAAMATTACGQTKATPSAETSGPVISGSAPVSEETLPECAPIFIPDLPSKLSFAGEEVPLQYAEVREALEREISVTMYMHSRTMITLRNTTRYFPMIEPILKKYGIPEDFKYLCMAESGLNPNAQSTANACGLWQFISSAAREYGVETGENVDLRYNIEVATEAACKYLKASYAKYGSWTLAAASYNAGVGGVSRRLETQGVASYYDMFLPEETMRYVFRILSFKVLTENPEKYGFHIRKSDYYPTYSNYKTVQVNDASIEWSKFALAQGTNYKVLRILNPWIRSYTYENKTQKSYTVKIPTENFREEGF